MGVRSGPRSVSSAAEALDDEGMVMLLHLSPYFGSWKLYDELLNVIISVPLKNQYG